MRKSLLALSLGYSLVGVLCGGTANAFPVMRTMNATTTITGSSRINTVEEYSGTSSLLDQTQRMTQSSISGTCPSGGCTSSVESVQQQVIRQENRAFNGRVEGLTELNINKLETLTECGLDFGLGL